LTKRRYFFVLGSYWHHCGHEGQKDFFSHQEFSSHVRPHDSAKSRVIRSPMATTKAALDNLQETPPI
jgi:hypothetical protein